MTRVLFVCMGNICRSPLSEGILRRKTQERGLEGKLEVGSCGTGGCHEGDPADPRTVQVVARYVAGFAHTARQVRAQDLTDHEHVFVLDKENLQTLERMFLQHRERARLLLDLNGGGEVPDPYYGSLERFEAVYRMLGQALEVFLETYLPRLAAVSGRVQGLPARTPRGNARKIRRVGHFGQTYPRCPQKLLYWEGRLPRRCYYPTLPPTLSDNLLNHLGVACVSRHCFISRSDFMDGTFELLGPIEILQLLSQARQTGAFMVSGGEVYLERGQPVHAHYKGKVGSEGLFQILALKEGEFRYLSAEKAKQTSLDGPLDNYLLQAIRFIDAQLDLSPFDQVQLADASRATHLTLSPDELELLRHMSKPINLFDLSAVSEISSDLVNRNISRLARLGLVQVNARTPHTVRLRVGRLEGSKGARIDTQLLRAWRNHYGPFSQIEILTEERIVQLAAEAKSNLGPQLLLCGDTLFLHKIGVGQEVQVWPAL